MNVHKSQAPKVKKHDEQSPPSSASVGQHTIFQFADRRPETAVQKTLQAMVNSGTKPIVQRQKKGEHFVGDRHPVTNAYDSRAKDLRSRAESGKLKDGEVELVHRPEVGHVSLPELKQSLQPLRNSGSMPVADALNSNSASIRDGKVQMHGIEGSSQPNTIAQQLGKLGAQTTRIHQGSGDRFEVQAKLNPWVRVLTGKILPELDPPQGKLEDGAPHPSESGVIWKSEHSELQPLRQYGNEDTYRTFMGYLEEVDDANLDPDEKQNEVQKQKLKTRLLLEFHQHLKTLPVAEIHRFGKQLEESINQHEEGDTLEKAFEENRAIYRSWHKPARISQSADHENSDGQELVGPDSLNVSRDPKRFRAYKEQSKEEGSKLIPLGAVPSSVLYAGEKNTVFNKDRGTATALLPENLYAGFSAYNETVKSRMRETPEDKRDEETQALNTHAKEMRASVTRPVFYNKEDIQSSTGAYEHEDKAPGPHVRKTHSDLGLGHNPLRQSLDQKLHDPFRSIAIFYQTFTKHSKANPHADEWNEMVVKYRSTGHTAGLHENIRGWVPGLEPNDEILERLDDSGKFSEDFAKSTAKWADKPLRGEDFDPKKETKTKRKKRGKK